MRAMTSLDISSNEIVSSEWMDPPRQDLKVGDLVDGNPISEIDEDDGQVCVMNLSGIKALADAIPDMGAISSVNVLGNSIGVEQAQELIKILQARDKLTTLCGFSGDETELDLSNKNLSDGCAVLIANEISDMGALSVIGVSFNNFGRTGALSLCNALLCCR